MNSRSVSCWWTFSGGWIQDSPRLVIVVSWPHPTPSSSSVKKNVLVLCVGDLISTLQPPHCFSHVFGLEGWCVAPLFTNIQCCKWIDKQNWVNYKRTWLVNNSPSPCIHQLYSPSSTISPAKTLEIPDMAMTTFWETDDPVMDWINWNGYYIKWMFQECNILVTLYSKSANSLPFW